MFQQFKSWLTPLQRWFVGGVMALILCVTLLSACLVFYATEGSKATQQRIYESSLWNALQFQLQSYRFINYLIQIKPADLPLHGQAYNQYDLLMSRLDLLHNGEVGYLIRGLTGGRTIRLLNIITGQLELISLNLAKIEKGDLSYLDGMTKRLQSLDKQVNEFTVLVSQDTNRYIATQRRHLGDNLSRIQWLMGSFLLSLLCLIWCLLKGYQTYKKTLQANQILKKRVLHIHEEKANLLGMMEQDVRPSIQALSTLSDKLVKSDDQSTKALLTSHIKESGQQLITSLNMFTDLALLEAQNLKFKAMTGHIEEHVERCAQALSPQIQRKGICLATYVDAFIQHDISLDFKRFSEILMALLQNAITHTPNGGTISVQIRPSSITALEQNSPENTQSIQMMRIVIQDNGVGMPTPLQDALRTNNPFSPIEADDALQYEVGLGLAFCYQLVHVMKGDIHFTSTHNVGTEFWVDMPYFVPTQAEPVAAPIGVPAIKSALIIEQDAILTNILTLQLATMNIEAMLYDPQYVQADEDFDVILMTQPQITSHDMEISLQQWQSHQKMIVYSPLFASTEAPINDTEHRLPTPLTQTSLRALISKIS